MNIELGSISVGWREAVLVLIALIAIYMLVVVWRMKRLLVKERGDDPAGKAAEAAEPAAAVLPGAEDPDWQARQARQAQETFMGGIESELAQLRDEVDVLRAEVAALRNEMRQEIGHLRANQTVPPLYNDAVQMAQVGHDAATIAERCGIARAEADLVVALVKNQNN